MSGHGESSAGKASSGGVSSLCCWSCRCTVAVLGCLSLMNMHAQQMAMSASLGCMLNSSLIVHQVISLDNYVDSYACQHSASSGDPSPLNQSSYSVRLKHPPFKISASISWERHAQNLILGAFPWGYLFSLVIGGLFAFKSSAHKLLGYSQVAMSFSTLMTPIASMYMHVYAVVGLQFMAGLGAGSTYPAIVALWQRWAPPGERTRLLAVTFCGIPLGVFTATSSIQVTCYYTTGNGWSALFYSLGLFGFLWFILWMTLVSNCPEKHRRISEAERQYISKTLSCHDNHLDQVDIPWRNIFCGRLLWSIVPIQCFTEWGLYLLTYVVPVYLRDVKHADMNQFSNGYFSTAPFSAFLAVLIVFGMLADGLISCGSCRVETVRKIYATAGVLSFGAGILLLTFVKCEDWMYLVFIVTGVTGLHALQYCSSVIAPMDRCSRYAVVLVTFSQAVAQLLKIICTYISNFFTTEGGRDEWQIIMYVSAASAVVSGAAFLMFDAEKLKIAKTDNVAIAFANEELSSGEQAPSRMTEEGLTGHQTKPFMVGQDVTGLDVNSIVGLCNNRGAERSMHFETEDYPLKSSYSSLDRESRRKGPMVSIV